MNIAGLRKTSLIDYPGNICATVFLPGCNMRCPFCHNPGLVEYTKEVCIGITAFVDFLKRRIKVLDGVCITGGEPTLQGDLLNLVRQIKTLGLKVKLDTNGTNLAMLQELINLGYVDYVAMDIKGARDKYLDIVRASINMEDIDKSVEVLKNSTIDYEFRTTVVPGLVMLEDLIDIAKWLSGARLYVLQQFRPTKPLLDPSFEETKPYTSEQIQAVISLVRPYVQEVMVRGM